MPLLSCPACGTVAEPTPGGACSWCGGALADATLTHVPAPDAPTLDAGPRPVPDPRRWSIPGYEILGELGRGGMGVVYRAREVGLDREVALKVLLAGAHAGATERARFRAEAEAAAALRHPHTVQVFRVGEHQGLPYLSLELISGGTLADRLKAGPLEVADAVALVEKAARAVATAHAAGIAHRDLKPANVLLTADGEPKVADFGLVRREDSELTATGAVMGTPAYMAPEQARGNTKAVGPAADVWALGVILYEALTGRSPFLAETPADTIRNVLENDPPAVRKLRPEVAKDLQAVCLKCLEKDPRRRYASAAELADDLARHQRGEPVTARRAPVWARMARRAARYRVPAAIAAAVLLAAAGTAVVLSLTKGPPPVVAESPGLPADLAAIPPDAAGFLTVRVGDAWTHPGVDAVARDLFGLGRGDRPDPDRLGEMLHEFVGLLPSEIERATLVFPTDALFGAWEIAKDGHPKAEPRFLLVVRSSRPIDLAQARTRLEELFGVFARLDRRDRWYLETAGTPGRPARQGLPPFALFAITDRDVAFGTAEDIRGVIDRVCDGPADGPLTPAVAAADPHTAVLAVRPTAGRLDLYYGLALSLTGDRADTRLENSVRALGSARLAVATLDLLPPEGKHVLLGLDLTVRFDFDGEPAAAAATPAVRDVLARLAATRSAPRGSVLSDVLGPHVRTAVAETTVQQTGPVVEVAYRPRWSPAAVAEVRRAAVAAVTTWAGADRYRAIGIALHQYELTHGHLPPAVVRDKTGRALRSWRVELLPFLNEDLLYRRLKLDEPWDSPHNKPLLEAAPTVFADPDLPKWQTRVQAVVGPGTAFEPGKPVRLADIKDGTANTFLFVEAADPVHWAEPKDYALEPGKAPRVGRPDVAAFLAAMGDGHIETLPKAIPPKVFEAAATRAGGEIFQWPAGSGQKAKR
jgi:hypothetical protein